MYQAKHTAELEFSITIIIYVTPNQWFMEISVYVSEMLATVAVNVDKLINISLLT
jgi:hypothetical protein